MLLSNLNPREFVLRLRRSRLRKSRELEIKALSDEILTKIDRQRFVEQFSGYEDKLIWDLERWMREAVTRCFVHGIDKLKPGSSVCDIGCGSGYFMLACQHFGLRVVGIDLDRDPMYNEMIDYLGLERVVHCIEPNGNLPALPAAPFHAVTAFMTCFNRFSDGSPWTDAQWGPFLDDLRGQMVQRGRVIIKFNRNKKTQQPFPPSVARMASQLRGYEGGIWSDVMELTAI